MASYANSTSHCKREYGNPAELVLSTLDAHAYKDHAYKDQVWRLRLKRTPDAIGNGMTMDMDNSPEPPECDGDVAFITALAEILRENCLEELEVERHRKGTGKLTVRLSRSARKMPAASTTSSPTDAPVASAPPTLPPEPLEPLPPEDSDPANLPGAVLSPMVGTAYLAPEPGTAPFVSLGDSVTEGQTLLIIEAMKTMNQIHATKAGVVKRILVEDASPVEYGAPLMIVG